MESSYIASYTSLVGGELYNEVVACSEELDAIHHFNEWVYDLYTENHDTDGMTGSQICDKYVEFRRLNTKVGKNRIFKWEHGDEKYLIQVSNEPIL